VDVEIVERKWNAVQEQDASGRIKWNTSVEDIPVQTFKDVALDKDARAKVSFTPDKGGVYRARVSARDAAGNPNSAAAYMWVAGPGFIPWRVTNDRSFDVVTDKRSYTPGETAQVLIANPFDGPATALVTVERGRIHNLEVVEVPAGSLVYQLPVKAELAPNAYISVLVIKGVDANNPRPNFRMGVTEFKVSDREQQLKVQITKDKETASPSEAVKYRLITHDFKDQPIDAELSVALTDLATLSLLEPNARPIKDFFYNRRNLAIWTSLPLTNSIEDYNAEIQDRLKEGAGMGSGGGGKGLDELGVMAVRQNFPDTAYWDAQVQTGPGGATEVQITLPDNLTTWRLQVTGATAGTIVGQNTLDLISAKPLLIRPQTPRFFTEGDQATVGAVVQNNTDQPLSVKVTVSAKGFDLSGETAKTVEVAAKRSTLVTWDGAVQPNAERVDLTFGATAAGPGGVALQDASRPPLATLPDGGLPVYRFEARETGGTSGVLSAAGSQTEAVSLPPGLKDPRGNLAVRLEPSIAAGVINGLDLMQTSDWDSTEMIVSRFLPGVVIQRAMQTAGRTDAALNARVQTAVETGLQSLSAGQNADGGWSWWPGASQQSSDPQTTAYALIGLAQVKAAGYPVNPKMIDRATEFLAGQLGISPGPAVVQKDSNPKAPSTPARPPLPANGQAFLLYALALSGKPDPASTGLLYDQRGAMSYYAQALLAETLVRINRNDPRVQTLLADLSSAAATSASGAHWSEKQKDNWSWNTDLRASAMALHALAIIDPKSRLAADAARWLMTNRTDGLWRTSQENAWGLAALGEWAAATGDLNPSYPYAAAVNGERIGGGTASPAATTASVYTLDLGKLVKDAPNRLTVARDAGAGNLYYTAYLNISLPAKDLTPLDLGISVSRSYTSLTDPSKPITSAKQGDLILGRVTIVIPADQRNVVVEDPLPAGLEGVDQTLLTSPQSIEVPRQNYTSDDIYYKGWGWWNFDRIQMKDNKVILSASYLPAGTYVYTYLTRAATPGVFSVLPPTAQDIYFPDVYGRGAGIVFEVKK
jgi:uncharacterized protein YfaS (alpha-2-macroglobulin family)